MIVKPLGNNKNKFIQQTGIHNSPPPLYPHLKFVSFYLTQNELSSNLKPQTCPEPIFHQSL